VPSWYDPSVENAEIIQQLRIYRAQAMSQVEAYDRAITDLARAFGSKDARIATDAVGPRRRAPKGQGVLRQVIDFVQTGSTDYDAHEVLQEFELQGKPLGVGDPLNTIRSALSRATKAGHLRRTSPGRYAAPRINGEVLLETFPVRTEELAPLPEG